MVTNALWTAEFFVFVCFKHGSDCELFFCCTHIGCIVWLGCDIDRRRNGQREDWASSLSSPEDGQWWWVVATMVGHPGPGHTKPPACHVGLLPVGKLLALKISRMGAFWGKIKKLESQASESVGGLGCPSSASNRGWALGHLGSLMLGHCTLFYTEPASSIKWLIWKEHLEGSFP